MNRLVPLFILIALTAGALLFSYKKNATSAPLYANDGGGGTYINLMPGPCVDPFSVAFIETTSPELKSRARAVDSKWLEQDGSLKSYAGCWVELTAEEAGQPMFVMVFSDGATRAYTKKAFNTKRGQVGA